MSVISVVGLGKLGACTAACFAYRGFRTIGMDVNPEFVAAINAGLPPVYEPRLDELLTAARPQISATTNYQEVVEESDVTLLIVPTPSEPDGYFSDRYLKEALLGLSGALRRSAKSYHLFVITSTVSPGTTEKRLIPLIEEVSTRRLHRGFGVCYNPEFIALGSVVRDFLNPDLVLIGESDEEAGSFLESIHRKVCENSPYVARMSLVSAEIAKLSLNAYVTMKISFANTLAQICEAIPETDVDAITKALGADRRVSPHALRGGPAYGGPCFPRDNLAFVAFASQCGIDAKLARATDQVNRNQVKRLVDSVKQQIRLMSDRRVAILGLAYKPDTPVIEESPPVKVVEELLREGVRVTVYDPLAMESAQARFGDRINYASSVREATVDASLILIAMPHLEFASINDGDITHNPTTIIDCWRILDPTRFRKSVQYLALGRHSSQ